MENPLILYSNRFRVTQSQYITVLVLNKISISSENFMLNKIFIQLNK